MLEKSLAELERLQGVILESLEDIKAQEVEVFDTTARTRLFDRIIIATATSNQHSRALAGHVYVQGKKSGATIISCEGAEVGEWVVVDFGDIVTHIMLDDARQHYDLASLWGASQLPIFMSSRRAAGFLSPKSEYDGLAGEVFL